MTHIESENPLLESMLLSGLYISVKSMRMNPLRTSSVCSKRVSRLGLKSAVQCSAKGPLQSLAHKVVLFVLLLSMSSCCAACICVLKKESQ